MLTALLPRDCCAAHPAGAHARSLAEASAPAEPEPCPMSDHESSRESSRAEPTSDECTLRAVCNGPLAALASLLSAQGVTPDAVSVAADCHVELLTPLSTGTVGSVSAHPDPPPPRV